MWRFVSGLGLVLVAATAQGGERLDGEELKAFYTDTTIIAVHHKLGPGRTYFAPDGTVHSQSESGKERIGKWWIDEEGDLRCLRWNHKNRDFCHYMERNDDGTHTLIHGKKGKPIVEIKETVTGNHLEG